MRSTPFAVRSPSFHKEYSRILPVVASITLIYMSWIYLRHVAGYFFLFDDYALLHIAQNNNLVGLGKSQIGFYRPLTFFLIKIQYIFFNWDNPGFYAAVSVFFHLINAILVYLLCYRLMAENTVIPLAAFVLFLISPWSSETFFWFSSQFDIFATFFSLLTLLGVLKSVDPPEVIRAQNILIAVLSGVTCLSAFFCKESAITVPFLLLPILMIKYDLKELLRSKIFLFNLLLTMGCVFAYLAIRSTMLDTFGGAYGSFFSVLTEARPHKVLRAFLGPPLNLSSTSMTTAGAVFYLFIFIVLILSALRYSFRQSILLFLALMIAVAPVSIFRTHANAIPGGRFLYLPGVFLVLLLCTGFKRFSIRKKKGNLFFSVSRYAFVLFWIYLLASITFQNSWWMTATSISRDCIKQFSQYKDKGTTFYIENLPSRFEDGPYILKSYAFSYYYQIVDMTIEANAELLSLEKEKIVVVKKEKDSFAPVETSEEAINIRLVY